MRILEVGVDHKLGERRQRGQVGGLALQQPNPTFLGPPTQSFQKEPAGRVWGPA